VAAVVVGKYFFVYASALFVFFAISWETAE